jgi:hypothetical protein
MPDAFLSHLIKNFTINHSTILSSAHKHSENEEKKELTTFASSVD